MRADAIAVRDRIRATLPASITVLMAVVDSSRPSVAAHIRALQDAQQCHVGGWQVSKGKGAPAAIYHPGPGDDVPNPRPRLAKVVHGPDSIPPRDAITAALFGPRP